MTSLSDQIPATKPQNRRDRDTDNHHLPSTSCKRIKFDDDVILRPDLKVVVECVSDDDVISEISTDSSSSKTKNKDSPSNEATSRRQPVTASKAPSSEELDEFFKEAEKYQHKLFVEKYNFDIVKDVPVEGRYEWVKL